MNKNTPVIIGIGQYSERLDSPGYRALSPMDMGGKALKTALDDCGTGHEIAAAIDTLAAIRQFEISTPFAQPPFGISDNPPRSIANRVGANPANAILETVGGQGPQRLVGELATAIAEGRSQCAAIVGSEAISTALDLVGRSHKSDGPKSDGPKTDWPETDWPETDWSETVGGQLEDRGYGMDGLVGKTLVAHGLGGPIPSYALFENARRARLGLSLEAYRTAMGALFAPFTQIAAGNPHAAARAVHSAQALATITPRNRIVAEPFPRLTIARDQVNQSAAIILASVEKARALGVPEERWVHIHAVCDAREASIMTRADLSTSPASVNAVSNALQYAGITLDDVAFLDFYSCFPIAVFNITDAFGLAPDDPRGLTLTGGLPFFGGAGNNYSAHAIVEAIARLRQERDAYALIGANGGYMSKYAAGIYSCRPANWAKPRWKTLPDQPGAVDVRGSYSGQARIETYTVIPGKSGTHCAVIARTADDTRISAMVAPDDTATLSAMSDGEPITRAITVTSSENGHNLFRFTA